MAYLTEASDIETKILQLTDYPVLWLDTEVAEWWTSQPKLSLIQVLADSQEITGYDVPHKLDKAIRENRCTMGQRKY